MLLPELGKSNGESTKSETLNPIIKMIKSNGRKAPLTVTSDEQLA